MSCCVNETIESKQNDGKLKNGHCPPIVYENLTRTLGYWKLDNWRGQNWTLNTGTFEKRTLDFELLFQGQVAPYARLLTERRQGTISLTSQKHTSEKTANAQVISSKSDVGSLVVQTCATISLSAMEPDWQALSWTHVEYPKGHCHCHEVSWT